jgi:hypothetical protein
VLIAITQVVFAKLARGIAFFLQERRERHVPGLETLRCARHSDLAQARADSGLPGDEGRPPRGAALIRVMVGEHHAFLGEAVDIRRLVPHQPEVVGTDVGLADVVAPDDDDVGLVGIGLGV